jgi:predicted nucleotidyltransferase
MPYGLDDLTIKKIQRVLSGHPEVEAAILYGSRAKDNFRPGSDIDLTLKGETINLKQLNTIALEIDDLLLPYETDLSIFNQIENPGLVDHINRVGKNFYQLIP